MVKFIRTLYFHELYTRNEIRKLDNVRGKAFTHCFYYFGRTIKLVEKVVIQNIKPCQISIIAEHIKQQ